MVVAQVADRRAHIEHLIELFNSGDEQGLLDQYIDDAVVEWPQSGEVVRGAAACAAVAARQPGGRPTFKIGEVFGSGDRWVATMIGDYGSGRPWHVVMIVDFSGDRIAHRTDYFAEGFDPPAWRADLVEVVPAS
jgi:SnoaL-like protein